jgi:anti-sigma factor RsiW
MRFPRRNTVREEEIAALADDSLPEVRREAVEAHVAASQELQSRLDEQRRGLALVHAAAAEVEAPAGLRARVEAERRPRRTRARARPVALAAGFAVAAAVAVALVLTLPRGVGGPDFAEAATLGNQPPTGAAPQPLAGEPKLLDQALEKVPFPNWAAEFGWRATGVRTDRIRGRDAVTVFYEKDGRRIAYTIVSGDPLEVPAGAVPATRDGIDLHALALDGRQVVTWERLGYTCILSGDLDRPTLLKLAAWKGKGSVPV